MWFDQQAYQIRCEWGQRGVEVLASAVDVLILVDVLSFSTCVDVATSRGVSVYPFAWKDERASAFSREIDGALAGPRSYTELSLSPSSMTQTFPGQRIVLPSPNGATLSRLTRATPTLTGCFRNAAAVARRAIAIGPRIGVVPAGERWPDGGLRPALEDWLGAGAILEHCPGDLSPEAQAARAAFEVARRNLPAIITDCASGRELMEQGWERDVRLSVEVESSTSAPFLRDGAYRSE